MDDFQKIADGLVIYKLRSSWMEIARLYNAMAAEYDGTLSMGFVLLTIDEKGGTPVTKIAPRMGMEPNSLSRLLKSMENKEIIFRKKDKTDKRKVFICLTEKGKDMREVASKAVFRLEKAITKDLKPQQIAAFFEVINHVPTAIEETKKQL